MSILLQICIPIISSPQPTHIFHIIVMIILLQIPNIFLSLPDPYLYKCSHYIAFKFQP